VSHNTPIQIIQSSKTGSETVAKIVAISRTSSARDCLPKKLYFGTLNSDHDAIYYTSTHHYLFLDTFMISHFTAEKTTAMRLFTANKKLQMAFSRFGMIEQLSGVTFISVPGIAQAPPLVNNLSTSSLCWETLLSIIIAKVQFHYITDSI
jgi:hypothetical protein